MGTMISRFKLSGLGKEKTTFGLGKGKENGNYNVIRVIEYKP